MSVKTEFGGSFPVDISDPFGRRFNGVSDADAIRRTDAKKAARRESSGGGGGGVGADGRDEPTSSASNKSFEFREMVPKRKSEVGADDAATASPGDSDDGESVDIFSAFGAEDPSACLICS